MTRSISCLQLTILMGQLAAVAQQLPAADELPIGADGKRASYEVCIREFDRTDHQVVRPIDDAASLSLEDLRAGNLRWHESLQNLKIDFVYQFNRVLETAKDLEARAKRRLVPGRLAFRVIYATKDGKEYKSYTDLTPKGDGAVLDPGSTSPLMVQAFDGRQMRQYEPMTRTAVVQANKMAGLASNAGMYLETLFSPYGDKAEQFRKTDWYVPVALGHSESYQVRPKLEEVDGYACHVATSGWDTIWIDHQNSFVVRRRLRFARKSATDPGCVQYLQVCGDFSDAGNGVFMPRKCIRLDYCTYEEPEGVRGHLHALNFVTAKVSVNDVPDDQFVLEFPPGTLVQDLIENRAYNMPGGVELLDRAIAESVPIVDNRVMGVPGSTPTAKPWRQRTIWLSGGALALLLAVLTVCLHRKASRTA